jgi:hypothetical protein
MPPKLIAFYLPQFHPIPENDAWWGRGFTEWHNVVRARPAFPGHRQPRLPTELGFYDLRLQEVQEAQAALAREYGIHGFCYYYYWFGGRRLLQGPLDRVLASGRPDLPFCICWANENWTRRWDGLDSEILIAQEHSPEIEDRFLRDVLPLLRDPRYIRVGDRPILLVYRVNLLPEAERTADRWRRIAEAEGVGDIELWAVQSFGIEDPRPFGFDAAVEFPPHGYVTLTDIRDCLSGLDPGFTGRVLDYREVADAAAVRPRPEYRFYRGVMTSWDNTARRGLAAQIYHHSSPELYASWLSCALAAATREHPEDPVVFVNAWNEWAEGAYLEPDEHHGRAYLEATRAALTLSAHAVRPRAARVSPRVSVVIPSYNHARYVEAAIRSVAAQDYPEIELIVVDDGSTDDSLDVIHRAIEGSRFSRADVRSQPNLGAGATIDRGVLLSSGEYVAILNSDDLYRRDRLRRLLDAVSREGEVLAFSGVDFCDENALPIVGSPSDSLVEWYRRALRDARRFPTAGFALLASSITVTTSNLFFTRDLFERIRGFNNALRFCHDWQFAISATHFVEPVFVAEPLMTYRYHGRNTIFEDAGNSGRTEGRVAFCRYLQQARDEPRNPLAPDPRYWPTFFPRFAESVRPWFWDGSLASARAALGAGAPAPDLCLDAEACRRDQEASARLEQETSPREEPGSGDSLEELLGRCEARWSRLAPEPRDE